MATKKETKIVKTTQSEITEGFVIYDADNSQYVDEYFDCVDISSNAHIYETQEDAECEIEDRDESQTYEIHQVKMTFNILKILKRKVVYEEVTE